MLKEVCPMILFAPILQAFFWKGISLRLQGDGNDYLGKGLCGGKIVLSTATMRQANPNYIAQENAIVGNTVLYGATSGKVFLNGLAGERFAYEIAFMLRSRRTAN